MGNKARFSSLFKIKMKNKDLNKNIKLNKAPNFNLHTKIEFKLLVILSHVVIFIFDITDILH
jgi:hypothetical protein